jgi:hypothetical protein
VAAIVIIMLTCSFTLTVCHNAVGIIAAQVILVLLLVAVGTVLSRQFHDAVPSSIRAGVSSGVGTLTWMAFVPFALGFGLLSRHSGVVTAGWMMVGTTAAIGVSLFRLANSGQPSTTDSGSMTQTVLSLPAISMAN